MLAFNAMIIVLGGMDVYLLQLLMLCCLYPPYTKVANLSQTAEVCFFPVEGQADTTLFGGITTVP